MWQKHWQRAQLAGIEAAVIVGVNSLTNRRAIEIAQTDTRLLAAIGFHPTDDMPESTVINSTITAQTLVAIKQDLELLHTNPQVIAIGEIGLDYFRLPVDTEEAEAIRNYQRTTFKLQMQLAAEYSLPVILHVRDTPQSDQAYQEVLEILKQYISPDFPCILHCVSGPLDYISKAVALGAYIGVAGNVTYNSATHIRTIVQSVPQERVLLETDAPFLAPQRYRGKTCEPWMIRDTAQYLQFQIGIDPKLILENTLTIFPQFASAASQSSS